ncbi:hypothetical protein [Candidatus Finniella inopinata]|uniref:Uncharacterized protein n=1 Tax=Candidatus Finniella inopinata TaxID=1696036 RepID=A0A4Q7DKS9_9PROT|nr:hypothetical protein [Candidatus Finniella inopinata]RZI46825.1 hypothetical protein EQU50_00960 [Candidatus Finniella inopinata]
MAIPAKQLPSCLEKRWSCYEFANQVLRLNLGAKAIEEWDRLWQITLQFLPDSHWAPEIIPYHYFLIANFLEKTALPYKFWSRLDIYNARVGDILIYQGIDYEPDPSKRPSTAAPESHIAFIDSILESNGQKIVLQVIDASSRVKGRCFDPSNKSNVPKKPGTVAYSFLTLNFLEKIGEQTIWKARFEQQYTKYLTVQVLRVTQF